jgi:GT2 family glycosyltransferase
MVDVAIVAYRHWELTQSCLEHLRRQSIEHRVIVCDNGCDQGTADRLRDGYPEVTIVRNERNIPNQIACNIAVAAGRGEVVVTMNNDIDARRDFLERLTAPFATQSRLGSVAPLLLRPGEEQIDSAGLAADRTLSAFARLKGRPPGEVQGEEPVLAGPDGAAAAFRRVAWEEMGGMEESSFGYMTDFDLALRLRLAGWETALAANAIAVHLGSATYGHRSAQQRRMAGFGRAYIMRRYNVLRSFAAPRALATEAVVVAGDILLSRDIAALAGRLAGWRAGASSTRLRWPPRQALDGRIGFLDSLRLRRDTYFALERSATTTAESNTRPDQEGLAL